MLISLLSAVAVIAVAWWVISVSGKMAAARDRIGNPPPPAPDGPGHFKVAGVDRATKLDTVWHCCAESSSNARAKGELEGITVTNVTRL